MKQIGTIHFRKHMLIYVILFMIVFFIVGIFTTVKPANRLSNTLYTNWTSQLNKEWFIGPLQAENTAFSLWLKENNQRKNWYATLWHSMTNIQFTSTIRFLRTEFPGFSTYEHQVIVANDLVNDWHHLTAESGPPLEIVLQKREAINEDDQDQVTPLNDKEKVVFLYSSHNRESFLPHLPNETNVNHAYHDEVNITKVSKKIAHLLENVGIGSVFDETDFMKELEDRGWKYGRSYDVSREVVKEAMATHEDLVYLFDIHRDSLRRDLTTVDINGQTYASLLFVIGAEHKDYEKNLQLATTLHERLNEAYPNISRGVITKEGANANGIYNQDLNSGAILIEFGGYENTLDEMYTSAEAFVDIFYQYYTNSITVQKMEE